MSERSVIVSVLVALVMVGLYRLTTVLTRTETAGPVPLLGFDQAAVESIEVARAGEAPVVIERAEVLGSSRWMVRWSRDGKTVSWPADEGAVRAGLRVLSTATIDEREETNPLDAGILTLHLADGSTRTVRFASEPLAGRVDVEAAGDATRRGLTDAGLFDAFIQTGLLAWRDGRALLPFAAGPSRVTLENQSGSLEIVRRRGRWNMLESVAAAADPDAAGALLAMLGGLTVVRIEEGADPSDAAYGFAAPLATIETETDYRIHNQNGTTGGTLRQRMLVGGPVDASGEEVFVRLDWSEPADGDKEATIAGPIVARVSTESLNKLSARPEPLISPIAVEVVPAAVENISLGRHDTTAMIERDGKGWRTRDGALLPDEEQAINDLLTLLAETRAEVVLVVKAEELGAGESVLVRLWSAVTPPTEVRIYEDGEHALVVEGAIARQYANRKALAASVAALVDRIGVPEAAAGQ